MLTTERLAPPNRLVTVVAVSALLATGYGSPPAGADGWSHYGASLGGDRYAAPSAITPEGVEHLSLAWVYGTGDATDGRDFGGNPSRLQVTPILVQGKLIASTGFVRPGPGHGRGDLDFRSRGRLLETL